MGTLRPRDPATLNGSRGDAPGRLSFFVVLWNVGSMRYRELLRATNVSHPSFILVSLAGDSLRNPPSFAVVALLTGLIVTVSTQQPEADGE